MSALKKKSQSVFYIGEYHYRCWHGSLQRLISSLYQLYLLWNTIFPLILTGVFSSLNCFVVWWYGSGYFCICSEMAAR